MLIRADGSTSLLRMRGGMLIGALPDARFATVDVRLGPGDAMLLYTDGLTEARVDGDDRYSEEQLRDDLSGLTPTASGVIVAVTELLRRLGDGVEDDTALLALSVPL